MMPLIDNLAGVMLGGTLYFMGSAIGGTRILALAMEKAPAERRARAMASFSIAFPLSNGAVHSRAGLSLTWQVTRGCMSAPPLFARRDSLLPRKIGRV